MQDATREMLYRISATRVADTDIGFKRRLYNHIDWDSRLICIKGPRGVGKTTMMLQRIKELGTGDESLYLSLDNVWVDARDVYSLAECHLNHGGKYLFLDEVHKLDRWQDLVKSLNDDLKRLNVVYSGSSLLRMESNGGDLSRRQSEYRLNGLSFREYLCFEGILDDPPLALEEILSNHVARARAIAGKIPVLKYFDQYRNAGYYPFYKDEPRQYSNRLIQVVNQVLEVDYPQIDDVLMSTVKKARQMLSVLSASAPLTPNMGRLYAELETDRKQGLRMLYALERAGLLSLLSSSHKATLKDLPTPDKIYCDNTNLMYALVPRPDVGTARETFFFNQLRESHSVTYPEKGDFLVDGKWLFEIGGAGKGFDQIRDIPDSFVVNADIDVGRGNKIPLWLFGFLY